MNTEITSRCQNCDGHIRFTEDAAGQTAPCPHCGMDTTLYIPHTATPPALPKSRPKLRKAIYVALKVAGVLAVSALLAEIFLAAARMGLAGNLAASLVAGLAGLVLAIAAAVVVILWLAFPVFMYFGLKRMEKLAIESRDILSRIERQKCAKV